MPENQFVFEVGALQFDFAFSFTESEFAPFLNICSRYLQCSVKTRLYKAKIFPHTQAHHQRYV